MDNLWWLKMPVGVALLTLVLTIVVKFADPEKSFFQALFTAVVILFVLALSLAAFVLVFS